MLLHVIDLSSPEWQTQAQVVDALIAQLGAEGTPCIRVYNKCDLYSGLLPRERDAVCISARSGEGTEDLRKAVERALGRSKRRAVFLLPFDKGALLETLHREAAVLSTEYTDRGTRVEAIVKAELWPKLRDYAEARP